MNEEKQSNDQVVFAGQQNKKFEFKSLIKRILKTLFLTLISILIIAAIPMFVLPKIFSLFWGQDIPSPNDQDLLLSVVDIPKDENAYFDLIKLSSVGGEKKELIKIEDLKGADNLKYLESYAWEIDLIEELLEKNEEALNVFSEAATKPQFQSDITADPTNINLNTPVVSLNSWRQIARISAIKSIYLMRQGEEEAAFDEAFKIMKIGHNIEKSKNLFLIDYLVGLSLKKVGLETIQLLINNFSTSTEILDKYQDELRQYSPINNSNIFRTEYLVNKNSLAIINLGLGDKTSQRLLRNNFYFKPNQTLALSIDYFRQQIDRFEKPCSDKSSINTKETPISWKLYFTENAVGKLLSTMATMAYDSVRNKKCENEALINSVDILFAIKKYHLEKGTYPENLQDLVPDYINELPLDPFSDGAFILDTNAMTISSIGSGSKNSDNIVCSYDFATVK